MKSPFVLIFLTCFVLTSCTPKEQFSRFNIELDGDIKLSYIEEIVDLQFSSPITNENMMESKEYRDLSSRAFHYSSDDLPELLKLHIQVYDDNNGIVDSTIYPYIVEIPIKTKQDLTEVPSDKGVSLFNIGRCDPVSYPTHGASLQVNKNPIFDGQYYHYKLVTVASELAAAYLVNFITDLCVNYNEQRSDWGVDIDIKSNTLKIDADEIKSALNAVGILH